MGTLIGIVFLVWFMVTILKKITGLSLEELLKRAQSMKKDPLRASFDAQTGAYSATPKKTVNPFPSFTMSAQKVGFGLVSVAVLVLLWNMVVVIPAGFTGVEQLFGKVYDAELASGMHLINPLASVTKMSVRTEQYTMSIAPNEGQVKGDDSITSLTKEGLDVNVDFTALYRLQEDRAAEVYRELGTNYVDKLIRPEIRGVIRDIVSQYEAKDLYSEKRQEASVRMEELLKDRLEGRGIVIEQAVIRNVQLPASLAKAIQEKLASEQESQRYDFVLEKEKKEADRKRIEAEGQRDAQRIIGESLSAEYLDYLYIKELKDRQGTIYVPTNPENGLPMFKGVE